MNLLLFNLKTDADDHVLGFTTQWINELARHYAQVFVVTMTAGRIAVAPNVTVFSVGRERGYSEPRRLFRFYALVNRILSAHRIDACFAHMMPLFAVMAWPLLRLRRIPVVLWYAHGHASMLVRIAEKLVDRVVASSRGGFPVSTPKLRVVGQSVDIDRFTPGERASDGAYTLLTIGRISRVKRLDVVIRAAAALPATLRDGRQLEVRLIGNPLTSADQVYEGELRNLAQELGIAGRVRFEPAIPFSEVHVAYRSADIFVNSSETNSVDKTVLEAMSCGALVITSNIAFREILPPELAAICVIPGGDAGALAAAVQRLLALDAAQSAALSQRLRTLVERDHSMSAFTARLVGEINQLCHPRARTAD